MRLGVFVNLHQQVQIVMGPRTSGTHNPRKPWTFLLVWLDSSNRVQTSNKDCKTDNCLPKTGYGMPKIGNGTPETDIGMPETGHGAPETDNGAPETGNGAPKIGQGVLKKACEKPHFERAISVSGLPHSVWGCFIVSFTAATVISNCIKKT